MRYPRVSLVGLSVFLSIAPLASGQRSGFAGGGFFSFGGESSHTPGVSDGAAIPLVGVYAEWLKPYVHPGLDLRAEGGSQGVHGQLVGPRASITTGFGIFHPYAEILAGPNSAQLQFKNGNIVLQGQPSPNTNRSGVTLQGVIGIDGDFSTNYRLRLEFSQSTFSGIPDSHPYAVTGGVVLHFR